MMDESQYSSILHLPSVAHVRSCCLSLCRAGRAGGPSHASSPDLEGRHGPVGYDAYETSSATLTPGRSGAGDRGHGGQRESDVQRDNRDGRHERRREPERSSGAPSLGGAESSLGGAESSLGGAKSSRGDAESSLGVAKS
jgi:hypothetical protein